MKSRSVYHPTTRVLTMLELLQSRARLSGAELAARLDVDLHRAIALVENGCPPEMALQILL